MIDKQRLDALKKLLADHQIRGAMDQPVEVNPYELEWLIRYVDYMERRQELLGGHPQ